MLSLADIDADQKPEVVASGVGPGQNQICIWEEDGSVVQGWPVTVGGWGCTQAAIGDIDGDGYGDIAVADISYSDPVEGRVVILR